MTLCHCATVSLNSSQNTSDFVQSLNQSVDVAFVVINVQAGAAGGDQTQALM